MKHRRSSRSLLALGLVVGWALLGTAPGLAAPPDPQPAPFSCATDMFIQPLGRGLPAAAAGQALVLVRLTFAPGGAIGPHTHPGTLVVTVESGTVGLTMLGHGDMTILRSGEPGTPIVSEALIADTEATLFPGDSFIETGMVHSARAISDEPAVLTLAGLVADGQPLTVCTDEAGTSTP